MTAADPWRALRSATRASVALGRAGDSHTTADELAFRVAHAQARDAVHEPVDVERLVGEVRAAGVDDVVAVHSAAAHRATYLQRPDLGRRLDGPSRERLAARGAAEPPDLVVVLADGLSARAVHAHAVPVLGALTTRLRDRGGWALGPVVVAEQARVALGDEVGAALGARLVVVLVGERPGLSAPDSLGAYLTFDPRPGTPDSARNCLSNIRPPHGQDHAAAARTLALLLDEARRRELTGVALKDDFAALEE